MFLYKYACVCVCLSVCLCTSVCVWVCTCICVYLYLCVSVHLCVSGCVSTCMCVFVCNCVCVCLWCICVYLYLCMYVPFVKTFKIHNFKNIVCSCITSSLYVSQYSCITEPIIKVLRLNYIDRKAYKSKFLKWLPFQKCTPQRQNILCVNTGEIYTYIWKIWSLYEQSHYWDRLYTDNVDADTDSTNDTWQAKHDCIGSLPNELKPQSLFNYN